MHPKCINQSAKRKAFNFTFVYAKVQIRLCRSFTSSVGAEQINAFDTIGRRDRLHLFREFLRVYTVCHSFASLLPTPGISLRYLYFTTICVYLRKKSLISFKNIFAAALADFYIQRHDRVMQ